MKQLKSISIRNSTFFEGEFIINFSSKLNCLMGGRGTGKSTILYFIKSALESEAENDKVINSILKSNLQNGTITIVVEDENQKLFEIVKTFGEEPQLYTLPQRRNISFDSLKDFFECDIYPALAIEEIGKNSLDRLKLIDKRVKTDIDKIKIEIKKLQINLNQNAVSIRNENSRIAQINEQLVNYKTAEEDLKRQKDDKPEEIDQKEQEGFEKADQNEKIRNSERRYSLKVSEKLSEMEFKIKELNDEIQSFLIIDADSNNFINKELIIRIRSELEKTLGKIVSDNETNITSIKQSIENVEATNQSLKDVHQQQQNEFVKLKQKFEKHKEYINKYNQLSKKVEEKKLLIKEAQELDLKRKKIKSQRLNLVVQLNECKKNIFNFRKNIIDELNNELGGSVKITLSFGGITDDYENYLRNALRGSNLRYNALIPYIVQSFTPDKFASLIHEKDFATLKQVSEIDEERSKSIINALFESSDIYDIESLYCEDLPEFFLKVDGKGIDEKKGKDNYKKSDELSTGQRCTTVLPIVFAVSDNPLLIDQPEDNLDNRYITETIHKIIREQKEQRQLIFITHNPNIPVLSDAELNLFLQYDEKKSKVDTYGTIDIGKEAFDIRKELYGD